TSRENSGRDTRMKAIEVNNKRMSNRIRLNKAMKNLFLMLTLLALVVLVVLIVRIFTQGIGWLDWQFLTSKLSIRPERAGILGVIVGTVGLMIVVGPVTMFLGVCTA